MFSKFTVGALVSLAITPSAVAQGLRDPTLPLNVPAVSAEQTLVLHSIISGEGRKLAVVNGELLREGDTIDGFARARLVSIGKAQVVVEHDGQRIELTLVNRYTQKAHAAK